MEAEGRRERRSGPARRWFQVHSSLLARGGNSLRANERAAAAAEKKEEEEACFVKIAAQPTNQPESPARLARRMIGNSNLFPLRSDATDRL